MPRGSDAPDLIDAMSPPGYPSARLFSSIAGFHFPRPVQFNPAADASPRTRAFPFFTACLGAETLITLIRVTCSGYWRPQRLRYEARHTTP